MAEAVAPSLDPLRVRAQIDELESQLLGAQRRSRVLAADNADLVRLCGALQARAEQLEAELASLRPPPAGADAGQTDRIIQH